jgi:hypothetical protein
MQQHNGFWISGRAVPGPPYTTYWETMGPVLKSDCSGESSLIRILLLIGLLAALLAVLLVSLLAA